METPPSPTPPLEERTTSPGSDDSTNNNSNLFQGLQLHSSDRTPKLSNRNKVDMEQLQDSTTTKMPLPSPPLSPSRQQQQQQQPPMSSPSRVVVNNAPITDKLLGMLEKQHSQHQEEKMPLGRSPAPDIVGATTTTTTTNRMTTEDDESDDESIPSTPPPKEVLVPNSPVEEEEEVLEEASAVEQVVGVVQQEEDKQHAVQPKSSSYGGLFGWFTTSSPATSAPAGPTPDTSIETETSPHEPAVTGNESVEPAAPVAVAIEEEEEQVLVTETLDDNDTAAPVDAAAPTATTNDAEPQLSPTKKEMNPADKQALDDAFEYYNKDRPRPRGMGIVTTPIPHADVALRLMRKFAHKTRPNIITTYGGSKPRSIMSYLFGIKEDPTFVAFRELMDVLYDEGEDRDLKEDSDRIVDHVLGSSGDSMARARLATAAFVYLFSLWGHASTHYLDEKVRKSQEAFSELLTASLNAATQLVAHGCLDGVTITIGEGAATETHRAVHMLAQSVFNSDLTLERNELAAMKFLLTTGCRVVPNGDALLRGTHLLQTIRTLYHVYLTTESVPNKTTARAALQQLVTSVFTRVVVGQANDTTRTSDNFPSENHRDAFLVLRSICKLSMRSLPDAKTGMHSHVGLQSSGSSDTWDGFKSEGMKNNGSERGGGGVGEESEHEETEVRERPELVYTAAIHPALESKLLALDLLLYVLQNTDFTGGFIHRSGHQFHAAIRNYLCVSLLKNCTSDDTRVVNLSLRIFVPLVRSFRTVLKTEIEAFVTNVFFVILDSSNTPAEHKSLVVKTFDEICSDPSTLAEIFLNYDCDLSAVDLFHRIVNTLSKISRTGFLEPKSSGLSFMGGPSAARMEKFRNENRDLRLDAMRALRQVLASLHASIVEPMSVDAASQLSALREMQETLSDDGSETNGSKDGDSVGKQNPVEVYGSKKKRKAEESEAVLRFNQKPAAGIAYAAKCGHVDSDDPTDVARYLLKHKDAFDKTQIGEYLGREPDYQNGFSLRVLHEYVRLLDLDGLLFDDAIRYFLSGFRLPGEAQKIDRIMEKFAERYTEQNASVFPTADAAFILAFSVIMLNTDLHNPAIKEERRMTKDGFVRNNRGICDGQDLAEEFLTSIFDRIKKAPISLKEDDDARERFGGKSASVTGLPAALSPASFFTSHYDDVDRARDANYQKEKEHIVRTTESLLRRRRHSNEHHHGKTPVKDRSGKSPRLTSRFVRTEDSGLRDEYVSPMFEVTWGPALAAFATAMESANGTIGALIAIASDEELELAAENAAETIEVCLTGFRFAICTAGLCGNNTARDAYMLALSRFSQLGTGTLLEPRHVRCVQTMMGLARDDGELLGNSWVHVFRALSEINRFHQLFQLMARNDRVAAAAAQRRQRKLQEKERRRKAKELRKAAAEDGESIGDFDDDDTISEAEDSLAESDLFSDDEELPMEEHMDARAIDEANARVVYDAVSEAMIEAIYQRSSSFSAQAVKDFVSQLCLVSRNEISVRGGGKDLNQVSYRQQHSLLGSNSSGSNGAADQFHHSQPNIYNLQKLVEVMHYNMDSRPRMIFAELWSVVADHLTVTALHSNPAIAMYAVDSFRQLSIQYLQRDELEGFEFQRRFLKPLEIVMAKSAQSSTKELLLDCVDRIIQVFGSGRTSGESAAVASRKGGLKSGWVSILTILGLGGRDSSELIANMSFVILKGEIKLCLTDPGHPDVLLNEHFVELVNALQMFVAGPHESVSLGAMEELQRLTSYLADETKPLPQLRKRVVSGASQPASTECKPELEFWWPILLCLSESVGDSRVTVRSQGLDILIEIIISYFLPPAVGEDVGRTALNDDVQTLQLVFRGILYPIVEFAEFGGLEDSVASLPEDFERFFTTPKPPKRKDNEAIEEIVSTAWLETTFDPFLDSCITLCLRGAALYETESLVDEIFAILNAFMLSDSGVLAVRGLQRLEQFVASDLDRSSISDDVWATVSHMLRRCLTVRGLPSRPETASVDEGEAKRMEEEYTAEVEEFIVEDGVLQARRYIGSHATTVIGLLLGSERFNIGLRWRLFLVAGLGHAIVEWEHAAGLVAGRKLKVDESTPLPPDYEETAIYGRKWMNRFLLHLSSMTEVAQVPVDADLKSNKFAAAQKLVTDETQRLLTAFLARERAATQYRHTENDETLHAQLTSLVLELLSELSKMDNEHLKDMSWINSVLLGTCIQSKNEEIRLTVQKLVQRTSPPQNPYPAPPVKLPPPGPPSDDAVPGPMEEVVDKLEPDGESPFESGQEVKADDLKAGLPEEDVSVDILPPASSEASVERKESESWNPMSWFAGSTVAEAMKNLSEEHATAPVLSEFTPPLVPEGDENEVSLESRRDPSFNGTDVDQTPKLDTFPDDDEPVKPLGIFATSVLGESSEENDVITDLERMPVGNIDDEDEGPIVD